MLKGEAIAPRRHLLRQGQVSVQSLCNSPTSVGKNIVPFRMGRKLLRNAAFASYRVLVNHFHFP
jgi:hypothetical protein